MKRFLYYNQDSVNSFLAQIEQGLLVKESAGQEETDSFSNTSGIQGDFTGDLSAKVFGIGTALKGTVHGDDSGTEVTTDLIRNVQEKVMHDYAFERVYNHVVDNGLVNNKNPKIGDIVLITEVPTFLDFDYFKALFSEQGAVKMVNDQNKRDLEKTIAEIRAGVPKEIQATPEFKKQIDDVRTAVKNAEPERLDMVKTIDVIRNTLPYNRFLMTSNMLMPLDDENFRDNPNIVAFKYGGKMTILGYVTNIVSADETPTRNNSFASMYDTVNQIMLSLFEDQKKIYIAHPVALFY